jgi:hypothetical protein
MTSRPNPQVILAYADSYIQDIAHQPKVCSANLMAKTERKMAAFNPENDSYRLRRKGIARRLKKMVADNITISNAFDRLSRSQTDATDQNHIIVSQPLE